MHKTDRTTEQIATDIEEWAKVGGAIDAVALGDILIWVLRATEDKGATVADIRAIIDHETAA